MSRCLALAAIMGMIGTPVVASSGLAQRMVTLNADTIQVDTTDNRLLASGNAVITYKGLSAEGDILRYDPKSGALSLSGSARIKGPSQNYEMDTFHYNTIQHVGSIQNLRGNIDRLRVSGRQVAVSPEKITFKDATITTCENNPPDFIVRSAELQIYPQWGFFVSFDNWVQIQSLPPLWVPTFIYGSRDYSLIAANANIPELSNSQREGATIKQRFGYFFDKGSNGVLMVGYAQALGPLLGVQHLQSLSNDSNLLLKLGSNGSDGIEYASIYTIDFEQANPDAVDGEDFLADIVTRFNQAVQLPPLQLKLGTVKGELINDSRVSKPLFMGLYLHHLEHQQNTVLSGSLSASTIEENTLSRQNNTGKDLSTTLDLNQTFPISSSDQLSIGGFYMGNIYSRSETWNRLFGRIGYHKWWGKTSVSVGISPKIWTTVNQSPFEYQRKYTIQNNEANAQFVTDWGGVQVGVQANYDLDLHTFRSFDVLATPVFHCWRLPLRWKTIEGQLTFGVELF